MCRRFPDMTFAMTRLRILMAFLFCLLPGVAASQVMTAYLNHLNILPLEDPYCSPGTGEHLGPDRAVSPELCTAVSVPAIPPAIGTVDAWRGVVDWVLIELRYISGPLFSPTRQAIIARKPGFLLSNGRIVEAAHYARIASANPDQCSHSPLASDEHCPGVWFDGLAPAEDEDIYLIVRHRNHLDIISVQPVTADVGVYAYDFSVNVESAGNGSMKSFIGSPGSGDTVRLPVAVMMSGDLNGDGIIRPITDFLRPRASDVGVLGYHLTDVNLNGTVHIEDVMNYVAVNIGAGTGIPEF